MLNKNIVTRWQPVSKTDIIVMDQSVQAGESQPKQHICNTTVLTISKESISNTYYNTRWACW